MKRIASSVLAMLACVLVVSGVHAEADIGLKGAGGKLSFVSPDVEGIDSAIGFGAIVDLGTFIPELGFQATLDFWSKSEGNSGAEVKFRDIVLGARTAYTFPLENDNIKPYVGGGLAIHLFKAEVDIPAFDVGGGITYGGGSVSDTETKIGIDLIGGSNFTVGENVDIIAEAMFRVVSDVSQFVISGGVLFWFGG